MPGRPKHHHAEAELFGGATAEQRKLPAAAGCAVEPQHQVSRRIAELGEAKTASVRQVEAALGARLCDAWYAEGVPHRVGQSHLLRVALGERSQRGNRRDGSRRQRPAARDEPEMTSCHRQRPRFALAAGLGIGAPCTASSESRRPCSDCEVCFSSRYGRSRFNSHGNAIRSPGYSATLAISGERYRNNLRVM